MPVLSMRQLLFALLLSLLVLTSETLQGAGRIYSVKKQTIEASLVPDKPIIMLGEPIYLSFVIQNNSDQDLQVLVGGDYRNALGRPESFTVKVVRDDGKPVPQPDVGPSLGGLLGPQKIEAWGSYTFSLFLPHWATFEEVGKYTIVAKRTLKLSKYTPDRWDMNEKTSDEQAQASTTIEVVPLDSERMGALIDKLGATMMNAPYDKAEQAAHALSYIQDERVIPHFVKALETNNYELKFRALGALSKFNEEAAFQALKNAMETSDKNIDHATTKEVAGQLAANIRGAAAAALAKSKHPGGVPFLLTRRNDPSEGVRITILHVLGKMKPEEALPILQEMTHDESKIVRDEAERYLNLLSPQK